MCTCTAEGRSPEPPMFAAGGCAPSRFGARWTRKGGAMYVLVAYATRRGPTTVIAERIASGLRAQGVHARAEPIINVKSVTPYGAVVLGGNAHMSHWLDAAVRFARHNRKDLAHRAVWLFSSSP